MKHTHCPTCASTDIDDFFQIKDAPTQSLLTIKDRDEALSIRRDDITLGFCNDCALIFNTTFDTTIDYYTKGYEDQQGFSPTFRTFLTNITNRLIHKYDLRNKDVIEIGCGKGDFLSLVCELGENRGIGIDPAYVEGRIKPNAALKFIPEFYSKEHGKLPADLICCRHTLEHIHDTGNFLRTIRESIGDREDVILFFEVPSVKRILKTQAFWDIFYEHCTYLSPGSIGRLFRLHGFEILNMYLEYEDQYLFVEAKPIKGISDKVHPLEEPVEELKELTVNFSSEVNKRLDEWRLMLRKFKEKNHQAVVWGGGSKSVGFLTNLDSEKAISNVVDINPFMQGNYIPGIGIKYIGPDNLTEIKPDLAIIMNSVYQNEIRNMLLAMNLNPELIGL
jgi:SAM-dependent methyltransferase